MEPQDNSPEDKNLALDAKEALSLESPSIPSLEPAKASSHASPSDLIIIAEPKVPPQETITPESPSTEVAKQPEENTPTPPPPSPSPSEPQLSPIPTSPLVPPIEPPPVAETPSPSLISTEAQPPKKSKLIPISIILLILFLAIYAAVTLSEVFTK